MQVLGRDTLSPQLPSPHTQHPRNAHLRPLMLGSIALPPVTALAGSMWLGAQRWASWALPPPQAGILSVVAELKLLVPLVAPSRGKM